MHFHLPYFTAMINLCGKQVKAPTNTYSDYVHLYSSNLALFPGLPWLQFLIAGSMQKLEPEEQG